MTRTRKTLTLCDAIGGQHPFIGELDGLVQRSRPTALPPEPGAGHRTWCADPSMIVLSWPGHLAPTAPIHQALAALDVVSPLILRPWGNGGAGWELVDAPGVAVGRMSSKFQPPQGEIVAVRVTAMLARYATEREQKTVRSQSWELVLPEIEYVPG